MGATKIEMVQQVTQFDLAPARYARPDRLSDVSGLAVEVVDRLLGHERFVERLSARLISRLELPSCRNAIIGRKDLALALRPPENIAALGAVFGSLWHASAIRHVIAREERHALIASIGAGLHAFILRQPALDRLTEADGTTPLSERIDRDGRALVKRWLARLPTAFAKRIALMLPVAADRDIGELAVPPALMATLVAGAMAWFEDNADV